MLEISESYLSQIGLTPCYRIEIGKRGIIHSAERTAGSWFRWIVAFLVPKIILVVEHCDLRKSGFLR